MVLETFISMPAFHVPNAVLKLISLSIIHCHYRLVCDLFVVCLFVFFSFSIGKSQKQD